MRASCSKHLPDRLRGRLAGPSSRRSPAGQRRPITVGSPEARHASRPGLCSAPLRRRSGTRSHYPARTRPPGVTLGDQCDAEASEHVLVAADPERRGPRRVFRPAAPGDESPTRGLRGAQGAWPTISARLTSNAGRIECGCVSGARPTTSDRPVRLRRAWGRERRDAASIGAYASPPGEQKANASAQTSSSTTSMGSRHPVAKTASPSAAARPQRRRGTPQRHVDRPLRQPDRHRRPPLRDQRSSSTWTTAPSWSIRQASSRCPA